MGPEHPFQFNKQAYLRGYAQVHAEALAKQAQSFMGVEPTLRFSPGRALVGGLIGTGVGARLSSGLASGAYDRGAEVSGLERALAIGGPALAGALLGGFTQSTNAAVEEQMMERQLEAQKNDAMSQYKAQMSGGELSQ